MEVLVHARRHGLVVLISNVFAYHLRVQEAVLKNVQNRSPRQFLAHAGDAGADQGSLTSLKDKLIKIGAKVVSHGRYVIFQMAEVTMARQMFQEILRLIAELRPQPPPALA